MYRRAYTLLVGVAVVMGALALLVSIKYDRPLLDPEGSFLGPSWLRLPLLLVLAIAIDLVPRTLWLTKGRPSAMPAVVKDRWRTHWDRERLTLVALGVVGFYITYVSYRNLKSSLPFVISSQYDRELHVLDKALFFGHEPSDVLHSMLGIGPSAYVLSYVYLWFLPLVPIALTAWLVWSRNISYGYWFATSQCIAWALGTASYYALPTLGPGINYPSLYASLNTESPTPATQLMESITNARHSILYDEGVRGIVNSVAGFASLHTAITLLVALMVQFTLRNRIIKIVFWVNFTLTVIATLYFGWHYVADDIAGVMIAIVAFYVGGIASGQKFDGKGLASHPTTTTSKVPVEKDREPGSTVST